MRDECGQIRALEDIAKTLVRRNDILPHIIGRCLAALEQHRYEQAEAECKRALDAAIDAKKTAWTQHWRLLQVAVDIRSGGFDTRLRHRILRTLRSRHDFTGGLTYWPDPDIIPPKDVYYGLTEDEEDEEDET